MNLDVHRNVLYFSGSSAGEGGEGKIGVPTIVEGIWRIPGGKIGCAFLGTVGRKGEMPFKNTSYAEKRIYCFVYLHPNRNFAF